MTDEIRNQILKEYGLWVALAFAAWTFISGLIGYWLRSKIDVNTHRNKNAIEMLSVKNEQIASFMRVYSKEDVELLTAMRLYMKTTWVNWSEVIIDRNTALMVGDIDDGGAETGFNYQEYSPHLEKLVASGLLSITMGYERAESDGAGGWVGHNKRAKFYALTEKGSDEATLMMKLGMGFHNQSSTSMSK